MKNNLELIVNQILEKLNIEEDKYSIVRFKVREALYNKVNDDTVLMLGKKEALKDIESGTYLEIDISYKILAALLETPILIATNYPYKENILPNRVLKKLNEEDLKKTYMYFNLDFIHDKDYLESLKDFSENIKKLKNRSNLLLLP